MIIEKNRNEVDKAVNLGLAANILLAVAKLVAGILGHSQALLADGVNSSSDVVYYIIVKIFVRMSKKPADKEHPYGHYQFESIAALVVGAFVITTGLAIFWESVNVAFDRLSGTSNVLDIRTFSLWVALTTITIKVFLMVSAGYTAKKTKSMAIAALVKDHRNDIVASLGAAIGISFGLAGFSWVDPLAGAIVAIFVAKTGFGILRESATDLMNLIPDTSAVNEIRHLVNTINGVIAVEEIHAHRFGPYYSVNITIGVDGNLSVHEGNMIADSIEQKLRERMKTIRRISVHYHPIKSM